MEHGSNLIERINTDLKAFEFSLIRIYPLYPLFPRSIKVLFGSGSSGLGSWNMECCEFKKLIRLFLDGKLDSFQLDGFVCHAVECKSCEASLLAIPALAQK